MEGVALDTTSRKTLLGKTAKLLGFVFTDHPVDTLKVCEVMVYEVYGKITEPSVFVLTVSEMRRDNMVASMASHTVGLGGTVKSDLIVPFAQRQIAGNLGQEVTLKMIKDAVTPGFVGKWCWMKE